MARAAICLLATSLGGCGDSREVQVRGVVQFQGQPVPYGTIYFEPAEDSGRWTPTGYALIRGGEFVTQRGDGCYAGRHIARIQAYDGQPTPLEEDLAAERIPGYEHQEALAVGNALCDEVEIPVDVDAESSPLRFDLPASTE